MDLIRKEAKTQEELMESINVDEVNYKIEEQTSGLFKTKKYTLLAIKKDDVKEFIKDYISNIAKAMDININTEIRCNDDSYNVMLICDENSLLIGREGKTLNSIQLLLHQALSNESGFNIRINVDAGGYKQNREKRLEREIKKICKDVSSSKIDVKLDPMNSYDRRIVHNIVGTFENLSSESFGEDPQRYVLISYKEK